MNHLTALQTRELRLAEWAQKDGHCAPLPMGDEWRDADTDWVKHCGTIGNRLWDERCLHNWSKGENCGSNLRTRFGTWQALACPIPTIEE